MSVPKTVSHLTSGRLLARNTIWNLLGQLLPMAVAVVTIPPLVRGIGMARFGVLSLAWIVIGYFTLFDLGIGRALTKLVADKLGANEEHSIPPLAWTSLLLLFLLGVLGGLVTFAVSPWLVHRLLKVPLELRAETLYGFYLLALSIPILTATSGLRGILEAQQSFRILNLIRIPMSIFSFAGPLLALPFSHSLVPVIGILVAGRIIGLVAHVLACFHAVPALRHSLVLKRSLIAPLLRLGGWMTVSNLVGPAILYSDRFVIGAVLSLSAVSYYTVPFDMVSRLTLIPAAISGVLFPAFALSAAQDLDRTELLLRRGVKYVFLAIFPVVLVIVTVAPEILRLWLGAAFAENSGEVLRWLAAGIFMNCLATIPFALLQGIGHPDVTGKFVLIDLPISFVGVWMLATRFGIRGAAIAWTIRATLETLILLALSQHFLARKVLSLKSLGVSMMVAVSALYIATFTSGVILKCAFLVCALLAFVVVGWFLALKPEERLFLARGRLGMAVAPSGIAITANGKNDGV
jgi:O-antigen/teichoic acid export membrane protein